MCDVVMKVGDKMDVSSASVASFGNHFELRFLHKSMGPEQYLPFLSKC